jgi:hypothetical protein
MERVKWEDSLDPPLEWFLLRNGSQTTKRGLQLYLLEKVYFTPQTIRGGTHHPPTYENGSFTP